MAQISDCQMKAVSVRGNRDAKQKELSKLLGEIDIFEHNKAPSPINPSIVIVGVGMSAVVRVGFRCGALVCAASCSGLWR